MDTRSRCAAARAPHVIRARIPSIARRPRSPSAAGPHTGAPSAPTSRTRSRNAPALRMVLRGERLQGLAAPVVARQLPFEVGLDVAVLVDGQRERQPRADLARRGRPAEAQARERHDLCRQAQEPVDQVRVVADLADRARAQPDRFGGVHASRQRDRGVAHRVEEEVEVVVGERLVAHRRHAPHARAIGAEHEERRRCANPGHVRQRVRDGRARRRIGDVNDVPLLEIALRRRRERAGAQQADEILADRPVAVRAVHAPRRQGRVSIEPVEAFRDRDLLAIALMQRRAQRRHRVGRTRGRRLACGIGRGGWWSHH